MNNIKRLKLTNCYSIKGSGFDFEPLHGSTVLELLDLSLVKIHESPRLEEEVKICAGAMIPILDSIIERGDDPVLKLIQFPARWKGESFESFNERYDLFIEGPEPRCSHCLGSTSGYRGYH